MEGGGYYVGGNGEAEMISTEYEYLIIMNMHHH